MMVDSWLWIMYNTLLELHRLFTSQIVKLDSIKNNIHGVDYSRSKQLLGLLQRIPYDLTHDADDWLVFGNMMPLVLTFIYGANNCSKPGRDLPTSTCRVSLSLPSFHLLDEEIVSLETCLWLILLLGRTGLLSHLLRIEERPFKAETSTGAAKLVISEDCTQLNPTKPTWCCAVRRTGANQPMLSKFKWA